MFREFYFAASNFLRFALILNVLLKFVELVRVYSLSTDCGVLIIYEIQYASPVVSELIFSAGIEAM
jgi:hypothetical protein